MDWRGCWMVWASLVLVACQGGGSTGGASGSASATGAAASAAAALPKLTDQMPSSVSANRPEAKTGEDPKADYQTLDQVYKAQTDAVGKSILFRGYGSPLGADVAHFSELKPSTERTNTLETKFKLSQRALVRGMPSSQYVQQGQCPRLHVQITGFHPTLRYPQGELIDAYDVQPDPPPEGLPPGVDFLSIDDAFLAGPSAVGRVADLGVYLGPRDATAESWVMHATGCSPHGGFNAQLVVAESDANRGFFESLKTAASSTCVRVRMKLTAVPTETARTRWRAEIVGVGDQFRRPHPEPNP